MNIQLDQSPSNFVLQDGRNLSYLDFGNINSNVVFYCHGVPGSRLEGLFLNVEPVRSKFRIISIDRPGMGYSDFQKKRTLLGFPDDLTELADHLNIQKFSILGGSGGGPYSYACAYKIPPERLERCMVVSGLGSYNMSKSGMNKKSKNSLKMAKYFPWFTKTLLWLSMARNLENEKWWEKNYKNLFENVPEPDKKVVSIKRIKEIMIEKTKDAFRFGVKGPAHDFNLYAKSWNFELTDIKTRIFLYHGELDINVPIAMAKEISNQLPNCKTKIYPNEGHLSALLNNIEEILNL
ncbi:MAG: alpha/beta fold hydrolase [Candidatus Hodarchaeales archaeon]|jgi:pimeloyl-ACP methyl ester carboxylesterase